MHRNKKQTREEHPEAQGKVGRQQKARRDSCAKRESMLGYLEVGPGSLQSEHTKTKLRMIIAHNQSRSEHIRPQKLFKNSLFCSRK